MGNIKIAKLDGDINVVHDQAQEHTSINLKNEWVKCSERSPKKVGRYLVYEIKGKHSHNCLAFNFPYPCCEINIAYYDAYSDEWQWWSNDDNCNPTHWAELPQQPKE